MYDPDLLLAFKFDLGNFTPPDSFWNIHFERTCAFLFSTRVLLVTKQMCLKSLEVDKNRRTILDILPKQES